MNIRKLCTHAAFAAAMAAGAVAIATPAQARLECNQQGACWWTGDTPEWQRNHSDYYANKWGVRINSGRGYYEHSYYRDRDRDHDRYFNTGYRHDRDYDRDYDHDNY